MQRALKGAFKPLEAVPRYAASAKRKQNSENKQRDSAFGSLRRTQRPDRWTDNLKTQNSGPQANGANE